MCHIRPATTEDMAKSIVCALVGSRLDYANTVLLGGSSKNVTRLQHAQNAAARVGSTNSTGLLKQLHWLPIEWRIKGKISCITYKLYLLPSLPTSIHPWNITLHLVPCVRLKLLFVPRVRTCFGSRSFAVAACNYLKLPSSGNSQ